MKISRSTVERYRRGIVQHKFVVVVRHNYPLIKNINKPCDLSLRGGFPQKEKVLYKAPGILGIYH